MSTKNLLQDLLIGSSKKFPEKSAVIFANTTYKYESINRLSTNLQTNLQVNGLKRSDRVIVKLGNHIDTIISFWGILKADAIASIIDPNIKENKLIYILNNSQATALIINDITNELLSRLTQECPSLQIIFVAQKLEFSHFKRLKLFHLTDCLHDVKKIVTKSNNISLDIASIIYTSGSTGEPKGVTLSHRNMLAAVDSINSYLKNRFSDIIICALPLSFDYGLYQMIMAFSIGATLVLEKDFIWPHLFLKNILRNQVTAVPIVPSMVTILDKYFDHGNYNFESVRYVTNTGAALTENHINILQRLFPLAQIYSMYGLTECKRCTYLPPKDIQRKPTSVGIAIPNTELWIVDENDQKLENGKIGQLVIRGETVMQGYWDDINESNKKLRPGPTPFEKVLYTGDYAVLDEEGYLFYHGRMDETIKSRGVKVSPKEIEDLILTLPEVKETAVFGIEDPKFGQKIYAIASLYNEKKLDKNDILQICHKHLEKEKIPAIVQILSHLPKNSNGKIDKQKLKETIKN